MKNKIFKILNLDYMSTEYIAYPWPEYKEYMGEEWFREECYYCIDKDIYFIPKNRINSISTINKKKIIILINKVTMAFIKNNTKEVDKWVGKWVVTTKEHSSLSGTFTVGSRVKIVDIDSVRGYTIEDKHGNRMVEIGFTI